MGEKLNELKLNIHEKAKQRLSKLEQELIKLIGETDNEELQEKFIDWQNARQKCNETFIGVVNAMNK